MSWPKMNKENEGLFDLKAVSFSNNSQSHHLSPIQSDQKIQRVFIITSRQAAALTLRSPITTSYLKLLRILTLSALPQKSPWEQSNELLMFTPPQSCAWPGAQWTFYEWLFQRCHLHPPKLTPSGDIILALELQNFIGDAEFFLTLRI